MAIVKIKMERNDDPPWFVMTVMMMMMMMIVIIIIIIMIIIIIIVAAVIIVIITTLIIVAIIFIISKQMIISRIFVAVARAFTRCSLIKKLGIVGGFAMYVYTRARCYNRRRKRVSLVPSFFFSLSTVLLKYEGRPELKSKLPAAGCAVPFYLPDVCTHAHPCGTDFVTACAPARTCRALPFHP